MRVLITGAEGQLGSQILKTLSGQYDLIPTSRRGGKRDGFVISELDITDFENVDFFIRNSDPQIIVNCAALTNVDKCEENIVLAKNVNSYSVSNLAKICSRRGIKLIQISTDYVFDGENPPFSEDSQKNPIQEYGKSKSVAEDIIQAESDLDWTIVRASGIFSTSHNNFLMWILESIREGKMMQIVGDQFSNPISALSVSRFISNIIENDLGGVWNIGSEDSVSRFDFAMIVCQEFGENVEKISKVMMDSINWRAKRPSNSTMNIDKIKRLYPTKKVRQMVAELA